MRVDLLRVADLRCHGAAELRPVAGVTAIVSRNSPYAAAGVSHAGIPSIGRSADATPTPPAISATP